MSRNPSVHYVIFATRAGWVGVAGSAAGLTAITLPHPNRDAALGELGATAEDAAASTGLLADLAQRLKDYFDGRRVAFPDRLDPSQGTIFQREVWAAARLIPYGETRSYGWLARQIGRPGAARAVGQALGSNPFPIVVPCHRVLTSDKGLGGFAGGLEMKRKLLEMEGAKYPGVAPLALSSQNCAMRG